MALLLFLLVCAPRTAKTQMIVRRRMNDIYIMMQCVFICNEKWSLSPSELSARGAKRDVENTPKMARRSNLGLAGCRPALAYLNKTKYYQHHINRMRCNSLYIILYKHYSTEKTTMQGENIQQDIFFQDNPNHLKTLKFRLEVQEQFSAMHELNCNWL